MKHYGGGFVIAVSDMAASVDFYCNALHLQVAVTDGTTTMLAPEQHEPGEPLLLALRTTGRQALHASNSAIGIRAVFFRVDNVDLDPLERRLRDLGGFHERHTGEFYEMISAYSPDRNALGFWALLPDAPVQEPSFVPPSMYLLD